MKRIVVFIISILLCFGFITGCADKPDKPSVEDYNNMLAGDTEQENSVSSDSLNIMYYGVCEDLELITSEFSEISGWKGAHNEKIFHNTFELGS